MRIIRRFFESLDTVRRHGPQISKSSVGQTQEINFIVHCLFSVTNVGSSIQRSE